jgi:mRNA-degrading endonuclease toxin of MazEF toxin-antitoxin module
LPGDKRRPVLVLTRDPMSRHLASVICAIAVGCGSPV